MSGQETTDGTLPIIDMHLHLFSRFGGSWQSRHYGQIQRENGEPHQTMNPSFVNTDSQPEVALGYMDWCGVGKAVLLQDGLHVSIGSSTTNRPILTLTRWMLCNGSWSKSA